MSKTKTPHPVIYQTKSGALELRGDVSRETLWATQAQIAEVFEVSPQNITIHLNNIYKTGELSHETTCKDFLQVQKEGKRTVQRKQKMYNLDAIISVGYRINSKQATTFRQWATKTLRKHLVDGYTINKSRIAKNYEAFLSAVEDVRKLLPAGGQVDAGSALELVRAFAETWFSLDAYDKETFATTGATKKEVDIATLDLQKALDTFRDSLVEKGEVTELFGRERARGNIESIVANVFQSFGGEDVYQTLEEKAAHILYFFVKNHPYVDGNKRHGAYAFIWFLSRVKLLNTKKMTTATLTALTLLVAESHPSHKDRMIGLVMQLLK